MDVAFVNRMLGLTRGGGELWDLRVADALANQGVDVTFYIGKPYRSEGFDPVEGHQTVPVRTPHLRDLAYAAPRGIGGVLEEADAYCFERRIVSAVTAADHDIVHVNSDPRFAWFLDRISPPVSIKMNGPPHSFLYDMVLPWRSSYDFFSAFDAVVATGVTVDSIRDRTEIEVTRIDPGVDSKQFSPGETESREDVPFTVLFVGRFVPVKRIPFLVSAFATFNDRYPDSRLVLVGDGPKRSAVESAVAEHELEDVVDLPGYVANDALPQVYRDADVFALTSDHESFGMVLLEAMSAGLPVVAPAIDWIPNLVDDGTDGYLYEPGVRSELAGRLEDLYEDEQERQRFAANARESILQDHDWRSRGRELKRLFETVL